MTDRSQLNRLTARGHNYSVRTHPENIANLAAKPK
jgi:hypothetical protein